MISAWKTSVKEALEAESHPGRVVDLSRTMRKTNMSFETGAPPGGSPVKAEKKLKRHLDSQSATDRVVENALHSRSFLEGALGEKVAKLLLLGGIGKASELFDASKDSSNSTLFPVLKEAGLVHSVIDTNKIVEKWQQYVGQRIDCLGMKKSNIRNAQSKSPPPEKKSCPGTTLNLNARNVGKSVTTALREMNVNKTGDAFSSLSVLCRSFLASIGIRTAHAFLATRSTDISRKFINWRKSEGKPELKGVGAIASVSGWKSTVRKKAKELGL